MTCSSFPQRPNMTADMPPRPARVPGETGLHVHVGSCVPETAGLTGSGEEEVVWGEVNVTP